MQQKFKVLFFYPNTYLVGLAPSNLAILSGCLKKLDIETSLFDCSLYKEEKQISQDDIRARLGHVKRTNIDDFVKPKPLNSIYDDFIKTVDTFQPNLIAVTLIDSTINFTNNFLKLIQNKNIPIIVGGVGATFLYEKILDSGLVDYVCVGEGEDVIVDVCLTLKNKGDVSKLKNIYTKRGAFLLKNPMRKLVDLNVIPCPDFSIYEDERFYRPFKGRVVRMLQTDMDRGCPYVCDYCAAPALRKQFSSESCGHYYRTKNLDKFFIETCSLIKKHKIDFLWMSSETFLAISLPKFKDFAFRYTKEINLPFWCQSRLDTFTDEKFKILQDIGCQAMSVGLEHGSEKIRCELLNKHISNETVLKAFNIAAKYNIDITVNNMIGLPDETEENIWESINLNRQIKQILGKNYSLNVFTFIPFSGTKLRSICLTKGYIKDEVDIPISFFDGSMLEMPTLSKDKIKHYEQNFNQYVNAEC